ncbi:EamA family transporter [Rubrivirga sp.]|uniref:EamA family transporter n=1 Tax=Rubrivirga sp. TaxID=1885344 RepID=UPI003C711F64
MTRTARLPAVLTAFATVYVVWGSTYLAIRFAIETLPPFTMAGTRFVVAGALLYAVVRARGAAAPSAVHWKTAAIVGTLLLVGGIGTTTWAIQRIPSGVAALLVATLPMWMVLIDAVRSSSRPTLPVVLGLVLGIAGIAILIGPHELGTESVDIVGALAVVGATLSWSAGSIYQRGAETAPDSLVNVAMQMLVGGALLLVVGAGFGERPDLEAASSKSLLSLAYLIVFGSLIAYSAYVWLLDVSTPAKVSTYAYVNPVVAVLLGWWLADEVLDTRVILAGAAVVAAVVLMTRPAGKPKPVPASAPT